MNRDIQIGITDLPPAFLLGLKKFTEKLPPEVTNMQIEIEIQTYAERYATHTSIKNAVASIEAFSHLNQKVQAKVSFIINGSWKELRKLFPGGIGLGNLGTMDFWTIKPYWYAGSVQHTVLENKISNEFIIEYEVSNNYVPNALEYSNLILDINEFFKKLPVEVDWEYRRRYT